MINNFFRKFASGDEMFLQNDNQNTPFMRKIQKFQVVLFRNKNIFPKMLIDFQIVGMKISKESFLS